MAGIAAGRLRFRIKIQRKVVEMDSNGAQVEIWQDIPGLESVPAENAPLSAREFLSAAAVQSEIRGRIRIRYRTGLDATMRAICQGMVYQFAGTPFQDAETGRQWLTIPVQQGVVLT